MSALRLVHDASALDLAAREQRAAADALASVWVSASAGTGKTKVLTDRVLSLLVTRPDLEPHKVLCITFTRAGAAEMATRVADRLGRWALASDGDLDQELNELLGHAPSERQHERARQLLAAVLDAPGGMSIVTIHAFCQSLLRRFPLEAQVAPHFKLVEERDAADMLADAREDVLSRAVAGTDAALAEALAVVSRHVQDGEQFDALVAALTSARGRVQRLIEVSGGLSKAIDAIQAKLDVAPGETAESIARDASLDTTFDAAQLKHACGILAAGSKTDGERGAIISTWLAKATRSGEDFDAYCRAFLTEKQTIRDRLITKKLAETHPDIADALAREADRLHQTCARMRAAEVAQATAALLHLGGALLAHYAARKRARGLLDYDDLIQHANALLARPGIAPWVLYKLDGGIDHILIDEAQDTSPDQWSIVRALADEFFAGVGQRETPRTVFAVGDVKQSIFSFQGADPRWFHDMRDTFAKHVPEAGGRWRAIEMEVSFRSVPAVLQTIDAVFKQADARDGVAPAGIEIHHRAKRAGEGGVVELWPPVSPRESERPAPWKPPVERIRGDSAQTRLARLIANRIARMVRAGEVLESKGRPIHPGDVMVLVRHRTGFVDDLVRSLKELHIAVAGVDRLRLTEHIAIMDLIAAGRAALLPDDDLTLATVLKGPLVGFTEEQLFDVAYGRSGTLWQALRVRAGESDAFARAAALVSELLARVDQLAPFEFYSEVLGGPLRGREKLLARLGPDAADPIAEFVNLSLAYETAHVPTLEGFLHWVEAGAVEIKRDLEYGESGAVRVLTVHGAKGLQAPIVFLPDTLQMPNFSQPFYWPDDKTILWPPKRALHDPVSEAERARLKGLHDQEHRRLLYVAMTRAADRLYVCGWNTKKEAPDGCWYHLIRRGLEGIAAEAEEPFLADMRETDGATVLRVVSPQTDAIEEKAAPAAVAFDELNDWARHPPPPEAAPPRPLAPSQPEGIEPAVVSPLGDDVGMRFRRGRIIHALLQTLPDLAPEARAAAARRFVARAQHALSEEAQDEIVAETLAVLTAPESAFLFAPGSRAEVPLVGRIGERVVSGQIDRMAVGDGTVHIVDFKSNRPPPTSLAAVPSLYVRQMALYRAALERIYPDKRIACYLLWTDGPRLMRLPQDSLELGALDAATTHT